MNYPLLTGKKILAVEDNSINQMLVRYTLNKIGVLVDIAEHGSHALEFLKENIYDIILMDIHMPELDGYQTTQIIRGELHLDVPIVAMTALSINGEEERCKSLGMNGYIAKPFTVEGLYTELEKVLKQPTIIQNSFGLKISETGINIDLTFLNELAGNDKSYVKTMIHLFVENTPNALIQLKQAYRAGTYDLVFKYLHNLKSSLSVIKVSEMFNLVLQIEAMLKEGVNEQTIDSMFNKLNYQYMKAENLLQKQLKDLSTMKQVA